MGRAVIHIDTTGACQNEGKDYDSDKIARDAVKALRAGGHQIHEATWTYGENEPVDLLREDKG